MSPKNARPFPQRSRVVKSTTVIGVLALGLIALGASLWFRSRPVRLPALDLGSLDPTVAATLRQHMDQVRQHPRSGAAWGWLGALLWTYDFRPAARECLVQAERFEPENPRWLYYHALSLIIATPNQAIPLLQRTVQLCGSSPEAPRFHLAHLLAEQGRWDEAKREFGALLAEHPDFQPARLLAARDAQYRGHLDEAIQLAQPCTQDPRTARSAFILLSAAYRQKGDASAAAEAAGRAAAVPPEEGFADPFRAEVTLLRGDPRALSEQAHPLLAAGRLKEATPLIDRLRQEHPDFADTWLLAGRLQLLRKDLSGAELSLQKHVQMNPRSAQGVFQLGLVLLAQERWTNAAAVFEQATQLKADFGPAHFNRGLALARAGETRPAMIAFRESLRQNPERVETYLYLADLSLRVGERESAIALLDQAQALGPKDGRIDALRRRAAAIRLPDRP